MDEIAYEIAMLRKEGVQVQVEVELSRVDVTLERDPEQDAALADTWTRVSKALTTQNDLLALITQELEATRLQSQRRHFSPILAYFLGALCAIVGGAIALWLL